MRIEIEATETLDGGYVLALSSASGEVTLVVGTADPVVRWAETGARGALVATGVVPDADLHAALLRLCEQAVRDD